MTNIIRSNLLNYQSELIFKFVSYLKTIKVSRKTVINYKSDISDFFSWLFKNQLISVENTKLIKSFEDLVLVINSKYITGYTQFLVSNGKTQSTVNRHLSSLRAFSKFCNQTGLIDNDISTHLQNLPPKPNNNSNHKLLIERYKKVLIDEGAAKSTVSGYLNDIDQFLVWLKKNNFS